MKRLFSPALLVGLILACSGGCTGTSQTVVVDRLAPTCSLQEEAAALTWFRADGSLDWTPDAIAPDGSMTVRYCDGPTARAVRLTGLSPGQKIDRQQGGMTDGSRRIIYVSDILTLSNAPVPTERLEGMMKQCIPILGSCEPTPVTTTVAATTPPPASP